MFPYTPALSPLMALSDGLVRQLNGSSPASEAVQLAVLSLAVMFVASLLIDEETADQQGQQGPSEMSHPELPHEATADIAAHTAPTFAAPTPAPLVASDHFVLTGSLAGPAWYVSLARQLGELVHPAKLPPLVLTSRPVAVERLEAPAWYVSLYRQIAEALHPPQLPPLELTSRPADVSYDLPPSLLTSLARSLREALHPVQLPPLELTSKPVAVAEMRIKLEQTRALFLQNARDARVDPDRDTRMRLLAAHYSIMENANDVARLAIRTCGGQSMLKSLPLERIYRDSRCGSLMLPWTAEICLDRLGRECLYESGERDEVIES